MKKTLLSLFIILLSFAATAQLHIYDGVPLDSTVFTFDLPDSLHHTFGSTPKYNVNIDTTSTHLWRIGKTHKAFFSAGSVDTTFAIMTDTAQPYSKNANDAFLLKITNLPFNAIIDFKHKYQTKPGRDGGIVEFSLDTGTTWQNVKGICNADSGSPGFGGILTSNFYAKTDTLATGDPAFTNTSGTWQYSRFQFFMGFPVRLTKGTSGCHINSGIPVYIRFRFVSDSMPVPMDGWIIDSIKIEADDYGNLVPQISSYHTLNISPNPSKDGIFIFPTLDNENQTQIEITNAMGQVLFKTPYSHRIDLSQYPQGLYLYKVVNNDEYYSGRLIIR